MLGNIVTEGEVGRAIFQSGDWNKIKKGPGNAPPKIFCDDSSPSQISVFILNAASNRQLTKIGDSMAKQRGANRQFYGWAELLVADASTNSRAVHKTPQPNNQWHADIVLPSIVETDKKEREIHANQLATMAIPRLPDR